MGQLLKKARRVPPGKTRLYSESEGADHLAVAELSGRDLLDRLAAVTEVLQVLSGFASCKLGFGHRGFDVRMAERGKSNCSDKRERSERQKASSNAAD